MYVYQEEIKTTTTTKFMTLHLNDPLIIFEFLLITSLPN